MILSDKDVKKSLSEGRIGLIIHATAGKRELRITRLELQYSNVNPIFN